MIASIAIVITLMYATLLCVFVIGLLRLSAQTSFSNQEIKKSVSIVVAFRNEEQNLPAFLESISNLNYPKDLFEIIVVNDGSEDRGKQIIEKFVSNHPGINLNQIEFDQQSQGKKQAVYAGVNAAINEIVFQTDADCIVPNNWIEAMLSQMKDGIHLVCGPVEYFPTTKFRHKVFATEFRSLVLSGAGAAGIGVPVFCNGSCLAFKKASYFLIAKKVLHNRFVSGDDVFFLHEIISQFGLNAVRFAWNSEATVKTLPPVGLKAFINQRIRWGSKSVAYKNSYSIIIAWLVFLCNGLLVVFGINTLITGNYLDWFFLVFGIKAFCDILLFVSGSKFLSKWYDLPIVLLMQPLYPMYLIIVALLSMLGIGRWKGRSLKATS